MENEIEVGEYFRSESIGIMKYIYGTSYNGKHIYNLEYGNNRFMFLSFEGIKDMKHSPNLIDIIKVGDYVNGHLVIDIPGDGSGAVYLEQITKGALIPTLKEDIETIVTKEQFESISYKVKE